MTFKITEGHKYDKRSHRSMGNVQFPISVS